MSKNRSDLGKINSIGYDERKERNKIRARKMVLVMGIACLLFVLAMMVEVYL